ncbi:hypothetical protein VE01_06204 [Pseudogymnoascus verrucosus]|uniref:Hydrophobin n=1 Tax=Pseudogymnoascus verrucosus TaxID=342668 RepID=A0A1B8GFT3_9PEZI|nr:uncharacterized protein VE01_06204 [Pseudogymnoascus verrucosus]OBT94684.1 hypothetical protein VE01_06204 [Pseudogymnoascus verrucosus]
MLSHLFTVSILALSVVVSATAVPAVDETADAIVKRACQPACCDLLVQSHDGTLDGVQCERGGIDCPFSGQLTACCESFTLSTNAHKCTL